MSDNINLKNMSKLIELKSVGSIIDISSGTIYPQNEDGSPDLNMDISLVEDEVNAEWWEALSSEDYKICEQFLNT